MLSLIVAVAALLLPAAAGATTVYTSNVANSVSPFSINADGSLAPIPCVAPNCQTGAATNPAGIALSPDGRFAYTANVSSATVTPFSINGDGSMTPVACAPPNCSPDSGPNGIVVSPDGRFVYTTNPNPVSTVSPFAVQTDGSLKRVACVAPNCTAGGHSLGIAETPDGRFLYVANSGSASVSQFSVGSDGSLAPIACTPASNCATGMQPDGVGVTPDGRHLYVEAGTDDRISAFAINSSTGALTPIPCTSCSAAMDLGLAVSPSGKFVYTSTVTGQVSPFAINGDGSLTLVTCPGGGCSGQASTGIALTPDGRRLYTSHRFPGSGPNSAFSVTANGSLTPIACPAPSCQSASGGGFQSLAISPDQAPTAAFSATPAQAKKSTAFNGSASSAAPGQSVARYDWRFGDGQSAVNAGPTPKHVYAAGGTYTVALTVTDDAGCSTSLVYTGQTASCNGKPSAQITHQVTIPPSNAFTIGKPKRNKRKGTATLPVTVPGAGNLTLAGRGIKSIASPPAGKRVTGPGTVKLAVKPKGKTKRKLRKKGKARVKATVTFTPTGGTAASRTKKLTLKRKLRRRHR